MWNRELIPEIRPDYIILDEFHRCGAAEWGQGTEELLAAYPEAKVLGLSATNIRYLDNRRDMAEELFDGKVASRMSLGEAIAGGILPAPVYITALYSYQKELSRLQGQTERLASPGQAGKCGILLEKLRRCLQNADGPDKIFGKHMNPSGSYLVFCADKERMEEMISLASEWFGRLDESPHIYRVFYDNSESRSQIRAFIGDKSSHLKLLYCIDMLNEGIHVADVDGVVLLRPTVSPILYLQQIGRALSSAGKRRPVIFDMVDNFGGLYNVGSLREQVEEAFGAFPGSGGGWQERFQIIDEARDSRLLFEQLQRQLSAPWEVYYRELEGYYLDNGDIMVPKNFVANSGLNLGMWLQRQRSIRKGKTEGVLTQEQIRLLDSLGMVWDVKESAWEDYYKAAEQYYREHHNLDIPKSHVTGEGLRLGSWLAVQRRVRRGSMPGNLTQERIARLDSLGMDWGDFAERRWMEGYRHLSRYLQEHGNLNIPCRYVTEDGYALGRWLHNQRRQYAGGKEMPAEHIRLLKKLDEAWEVTDREWKRYYDAADRYYREYGNLRVPAGYVTGEGLALGTWISAKRSGKERLSAGRIADLNRIGMVWETRSADCWRRNYSLAEKFYRENGHLDIPVQYVTEGVRLGRWVSRMRESRSRGTGTPLTEEQVRELDRIGMVWETSWDVRFEAARQYYEGHGNLRVPRTYVTGDRIWLGRWLGEQRRKRGISGRRGLTESQVRKLESIGMKWD